MFTEMKLRSGDYMVPSKVADYMGRRFVDFGFFKQLREEIKSMEGFNFHKYQGKEYNEWVVKVFGKVEVWSFPLTHRNLFNWEYLLNKNPTAKYDKLGDFKPVRTNLFKHQWDMVHAALTVHYMIWAAEMGTGKTLAAVELMEQSGYTDWWYVGPKSAIAAVSHEFRKWNCKITPRMMTYEGLVKIMAEWPAGTKAPHGVIFDESSRIKTPTSARSIAACGLADGIRRDWADQGYVILMSGSPAPKSPADWWHQCEVACPGFLREGDIKKFTRRLAVHEDTEGIAGPISTKKTWRDDESKCNICGELEFQHTVENMGHTFIPSVNEVAKLYRRMKGLVIVKHKKDCLDLPEKNYRIIRMKPSPATMRALSLITQSNGAAQALILARELSDGFQYKEVEEGRDVCPLCCGKKVVEQPVLKPGKEPTDDDAFEFKSDTCTHCFGHGDVPHMVRTRDRVKCPKDEALIDVLDEHYEIGRLVVYGGFQESVDRVVEICQSQKWAVVRWDGRGVRVLDSEGSVVITDPIDYFQGDVAPRVVFVGQPGAAGMSLTLTASPTILYYSNTFNGEDRIQSEDRIHRPGCRGANIIDLIHLPTDEYVLENLKRKRELQSITLGEIQQCMQEEGTRLF